jgi:tRNA-intron endonuclease
LESTAQPPLEKPELHIVASLKDGRITVEDDRVVGDLEQSGYGERSGKNYFLKDYEAMFLLYSNRLTLSDEERNQLSFDRFSEWVQKRAPDSWTRFLIYRDLRSRGYVVKEGFGFGTDLRVYERGDFPKKAAKYVVFALDEGSQESIDSLKKSVREITKMGKEAIVAVIERRGEVIYYKVSRAHFVR